MITYIYILLDPRNMQVRYVGKTINPKRRKSNHRGETACKSSGRYLRNWLKLLHKEGYEPIFEVVDEIPSTEWKFWEKYYISLYKSWGFKLTNITDGGDNIHTRCKKVLQYTLDGEFVREWESGASISRKIGIGLSSIATSAGSNGRIATRGFLWVYKITDAYSLRIPSYVRKKATYPFKKVIQYDLCGNPLREWESLKSASENLGIPYANIVASMSTKVRRLNKKGYSRAGGFIWKYK